MAEWRKLKVSYLEKRDIYRDLVRINADSRGRTVKEGKVYKVRPRGGKTALLAIRGADDQGVIRCCQSNRNLSLVGARPLPRFELGHEGLPLSQGG
jgi:hypothetical protein